MDEPNLLEKFTRVFNKGDMVFEENSSGAEMYIISTGGVKLIKNHTDSSQVLASLKRGDMFGEMALLDSGIRTASAVADQDNTRLIVIDHARFVYLVGQQPAFALAVMQVMSDRLRNQSAQCQ